MFKKKKINSRLKKNNNAAQEREGRGGLRSFTTFALPLFFLFFFFFCNLKIKLKKKVEAALHRIVVRGLTK
jgi:hypothetical protein